MVTSEEPYKKQIWRCFRCRKSLSEDVNDLRCSGCGQLYPVIAGIPILVSDPAGYLRSELDRLTRVQDDARRRRDLLPRLAREVGLSGIALDRHWDVLDAEIARVEGFLVLLAPAAKALQQLSGSGQPTGDSLAVRRSGWAFETLLPYLSRDWSCTPEFEAAASAIDGAVKAVFPDPSKKSVALAGCGAGGFLATLSAHFARVLGFDLTLPILAAARQLLDGKDLGLAVPRLMNHIGHIRLRKREPSSANIPVELLAMDACDTAFADGAIDCVITSLLIDLMPDPRDLAHEIHRILSDDGVWINYGPAGTRESLWRFDNTEAAAFCEAIGFSVLRTEAHRTTYLDLSRDDPTSSFQSHVCYLTVARKVGPAVVKSRAIKPSPVELSGLVPCHFPGANLVQQLSLGPEQTRSFLLRHERVFGRAESLEIGSDTARIMALVDGKRTVSDIAALLKQRVPPHLEEETFRAFGRYFDQGLLGWREPRK